MGNEGFKISDSTKSDIDSQVAQLVKFAYKSALDLINIHEESFLQVIDILSEKRIISGDDISYILKQNKNKEKKKEDVTNPEDEVP
jgi:ATP-dependent Zn protease